MKSYLITALCAVLMFGCNENTNQSSTEHSLELDSTSRFYDQNYKVYTLEGCEYIVVGIGKYQWGSHKGNCKNPIHKSSVESIEKHWPCTVQSITTGDRDNKYMYITECGVGLWSNDKFSIGDTLHNFESPKHP